MHPKSESEVAELYRSLGVAKPEEWAAFAMSDPDLYLARYLFLKQAWERIIGEEEVAWIEEAIDRSKTHPSEPYAGLGLALQRVLAAGASRKDVSEIGRCLQAQALFGLGYLVDGPAYPEEGFEDIDWGLFRVDEEGNPFGEPIKGLHESVLETDPTGREMRPKDGA